ANIDGVHAMTDVTGFGLLGHLLEVCRGSALAARVRMADVPLLDDVAALASAGFVTGASARNWASYGDEVRLAPVVCGTDRALLCDPQTSGGLLIACARDALGAVLEILHRHGFSRPACIGEMVVGTPRVTVEG
ncbi:MAG TPA: AIR synthase-related protein, partial [Steroidobacteraceae bacterium]